jgi:hypothetical protein
LPARGATGVVVAKAANLREGKQPLGIAARISREAGDLG